MKLTRQIVIGLLLALGVAGFAVAQSGDNSSNALPAAPSAQAPPKLENSFQGYFSIGGLGMQNRDYIGRVSEFTTATQGGRGAVGGAFWGNYGRVHFDIRGEIAGNENDQGYSLLVDVNRYWKTTVNYTRLPHRLDHDPLESLDAGKGAIIVRADNADPSALYAITHGELEVDSRFVIPRLKGAKFHFGFRDQRRDGTTHARTLSKCANCHVVGVTRGVDQVTQDFTAGASIRIKRVSLEYSYLNRSFRERAPAPLNTYDLVQQPATTAKIFDNRIQYQLASGPLPFNQIPDVTRETHSFRAGVELPYEAEVTLNFAQSSAENEDTGLGVDSKVWSARFGVPVGPRGFFTARYRQLQIQGDEVFIDVAEPAAIAGPQLGNTYAQSYPTYGTVDYMRTSEESRRPLTAELEFSYRLAKRTTMRAGYTFERVRRDNFEVYESRRNILRLSLNARSADRNWHFRSAYRLEDMRDPFANVNAAYMPVMQPYASPGSPPSPLLGTQYYTLYRTREANLTAFPTRVHSVEQSATWAPGTKFSLSGHLRWRNQTHETLNMSSWGNATLSPSGEVWFAPHPRVALTAAYHFLRDTGETFFVLPVFDG